MLKLVYVLESKTNLGDITIIEKVHRWHIKNNLPVFPCLKVRRSVSPPDSALQYLLRTCLQQQLYSNVFISAPD